MTGSIIRFKHNAEAQGFQAFAQQTLVDGANIAWDLDLGAGEVTLGGNRTLDNPGGMADHVGQLFGLRVIQDGTGTRLLTWGSAYDFAGGTPPTLSTGVTDIDQFVFYCTGTKMVLVGSALNIS